MRYVLIPVLLGAFGALAHLAPILGAPSLTQPSPARAYLGLAGTVVFFALAFVMWSRARTAFHASWTGLLLGFGYFAVSLHWLGESVVPDPSTYSLRAALTALGAWTLLYPWWALAFGLAHILTGMARASRMSGVGVILFAVIFSIADVLMGDFAFRIPLSPPSAAVLDTLWQPLVGVVGQHGSTALLVAVSASLALCACLPSRQSIAGATAALCAATAPSTFKGIDGSLSIPGRDATIYLTQPNAETPYQLSLRGDPTPDMTIMAGIYRALDAGTGADLIVLPENAVPLDLATNPEVVRDLADRLSPGSTLIAGFRHSVVSDVSTGGFEVETFNTAYAITAAGEVAFEYDKAHLVPFGEYMPGIFYDLGFNVIAGPTITPGPSLDVFSLPNMTPFSILICYEGLLSGPVSRETAGADWFLNISSEGLFGQTIGPRLLLHKVRLRAAETGIPMLRSASTGFTAVIDHTGAVLDALGQGEEGGIMTAVPAAEPTIFRQIGYLPLYVLWIMTLGWVLSVRLGTASGLSFKVREDE